MLVLSRGRPSPSRGLEHESTRQHDLPLVVLRSIFAHSSPQQWPVLRQVSKQLAEVGREFICSITVRSWARQQLPAPALLHVLRQRITQLRVVSKPDWCKLQSLLSCKSKHTGPRRGMPQLRHLILQEPSLPLALPSSCAALLQGITRLDISCPGALTLPRFAKLTQLRAASFSSTVSLVQLAQFAPNLEQLWASSLDCSSGSSSSSNSSTSAASAAAGAVLPRLTHLGCRSLSAVQLSTAAAANSNQAAASATARPGNSPPAAAAAAAAAAASAAGMQCRFPSLRVLTCLPSIAVPCTGSTPAQVASSSNSSSSNRSSFEPCIFQPAALGPCPGLQALRISGNLGYASAAAALQQLLASPMELEQLTRLSLHSGSRCVSAFTCVNALSQLQQLQHVTVTGSCSRPGRVALLIEQLALLPQLQCVALPAELLCRQCSTSGGSSAVQHALDRLVMQSSTLTRLVFLPGTAGRLQPQQRQHSNKSVGRSCDSSGSGGGGAGDGSSSSSSSSSASAANEKHDRATSIGTTNASCTGHASRSCCRNNSSSSSSTARTACQHPRQVSEAAAVLHSAWLAAAAFAGLFLAAPAGVPAAVPAAAAAAAAVGAAATAEGSCTLSSMRWCWQQQQQHARQQEQQQRMQQLQQLRVDVAGVPGGGSGAAGGAGGSGSARAGGLELLHEAGMWGVYGPAGQQW
uniref:F-box domain-containing protein n=1 Tax=Tetradesmus obliquus TaxID=3088 RepID=A0A383W7K5_TETOB|eukprot:jgi/Sobl393_1/15815/SZX73618.1